LKYQDIRDIRDSNSGAFKKEGTKMDVNGFRTASALGIIANLTIACATAAQPQASKTTLSYSLPVIDATADSAMEREIDGVVIAVAPTRFEAKRGTRITVRELPTLIVMDDLYNHEKTEAPVITVAPENLEFALKITNRLDHVLRFSGSALSVKVNGKRIKAQGDDELLSAIMAPGDNFDAKLNLGSINSLEDNATIALDIFAVPTVTAAAGTATKKTAFRWVFKLTKERKQEEGTVKVTNVSMTRKAAAQYY
jgi:hypothetical protein